MPISPGAASARPFLKSCLPLIVITLIAASPLVVRAQDQISTATDGYTPVGIATGAPAGSFALSGFDNINLMAGSNPAQGVENKRDKRTEKAKCTHH